MEPSRAVSLGVIFLPFLGAALSPIVYRVLRERTAYFATSIALICFALLASQLGARGSVSVKWIPAMDVSLRLYVDGLSLLLGLVVAGIGVLILYYSRDYMHSEAGQSKYYATLLAFMGSMLGVVFAADLIVLFVFWELTSLSSFVLIGHYQRADASLYAARKSMLITVVGGLFMLVGFLLLYVVSGDVSAFSSPTFDLLAMLKNADAMQAALREAGLLVPTLLLIGVGAATKSAQVPFHIWLPNAMEAPTPVSAFLHAATMVKAGVYLIGRFRPLLYGETWFLIFVTVGIVTMAITAILAVAATDIKGLLAYSTASHLGLIVASFGFVGVAGQEAVAIGGQAGAFHILNHALFKASLFLVAGIIAHQAGTRAISEIGGLYRKLPITAVVATVAALGMAGVPPFNGFYSKELLFEAAYAAGTHIGGPAWAIPIVAVLGSVFTFLYSIRFAMLFFGDEPATLGDVPRPGFVMLGPPALLAGLALLVGLGGLGATIGVHLRPLETFLSQIVESVAIGGTGGHGGEAFAYYLPTSVTPAAIMSASTLGIGAIAYPWYDHIHDTIQRVLQIDPLRVDWYYDGFLTRIVDASTWTNAQVQTGLLRTYAFWTLAGVSGLTLFGYVAAGVVLPVLDGLSATVPMTLVLLVAVLGAISVIRAPSHVAGVLSLSILGFMVAIFFILARAPDLALTQLVVETLLLVIFLLVLDRLPAYYGEIATLRQIRDGALAAAVGLTVTITVLLASTARPKSNIASYFVETAPPDETLSGVITTLGGGHNIVNVVLVDFRAFDTLGEISVIALAALSIITIIGMREWGESRE